ncbi:MAG: hypothetical protein OIF32_07235 [Campylobacterales bacterium]|nr:hypothetical protein [Campylobacterales bacterium]
MGKKNFTAEIEHYFVIEEFEDGWDIDIEHYDSVYEDKLLDYCMEVLFIPEEKIKELSMTNIGMEIFLEDLDYDDITDDWYAELMSVSKKI